MKIAIFMVATLVILVAARAVRIANQREQMYDGKQPPLSHR